MKRQLLLVVVFLLAGITTFAQQAIFTGESVTSPEINQDNSVTFRLVAPNASGVTISGDWMPSEGFVPASEEMTKGEDGIWIYTTAVLSPELYSYSFSVDGMRTTDPNNAYLVRDVASVTNIFIVDGDYADLYEINKVPHGTVSRRWYDSPGNEMARRITIYTPPGYEKNNENYPVLYLLHGVGGDEEAWMSLGRTSQILDNLIAQGKAEPMIVVMTNGNVSKEAAPGESSEGFIIPVMMLPHTMDGKMEETFMDVVNFVESNYRVNATKEGRAIAGLSMGGYHSMHISRHYSNTFDYVGLFSPAISVTENSENPSPVYKNIDENLKKQMDNGYKLYWIGIGKDDFLYKNVVDYRAKLDDMGMPFEYMETEGGHIWKNWRIYLSEFAPKLFK